MIPRGQYVFLKLHKATKSLKCKFQPSWPMTHDSCKGKKGDRKQEKTRRRLAAHCSDILATSPTAGDDRARLIRGTVFWAFRIFCLLLKLTWKVITSDLYKCCTAAAVWPQTICNSFKSQCLSENTTLTGLSSYRYTPNFQTCTIGRE